jgi:hypothetical protein
MQTVVQNCAIVEMLDSRCRRKCRYISCREVSISLGRLSALHRQVACRPIWRGPILDQGDLRGQAPVLFKSSESIFFRNALPVTLPDRRRIIG